jgi:hypothetical protein
MPELDERPNLKTLNGMFCTCPICGGKSLIIQTISAHEWGFMVSGDCNHVFPVVLS